MSIQHPHKTDVWGTCVQAMQLFIKNILVQVDIIANQRQTVFCGTKQILKLVEHLNNILAIGLFLFLFLFLFFTI